MKKWKKKLKVAVAALTVSAVAVGFGSCGIGAALAEDLLEGAYMFSISWGVPFVEAFYGEIEEDVKATEGGQIIYEKVDKVEAFFEGIGDWFEEQWNALF